MKKILAFFITLFLLLGVFLLYDMVAFQRAMYTAGLTENSKKEDVGQYMEVQIVDIKDNILLVRPTSEVVDLGNSGYGYWEYMFDSSDILEINLDDVEIQCELFVNKIIDIVYHSVIGTTGNNPIHLNKVSEIKDTHLGYWEDILLYNGRRYDRTWLSEEDLAWLEMSEEERIKSNYYPEKLEKVGRFELSSNIDDWGISLSVDNVTPTGLTLVCKQEDFIPTTTNDNWEIRFNSPYVIQKFEYGDWQNVKIKAREDVVWDTKEWVVENNAVSTMSIDWEWLYGELPAGEYRIQKEIENLKAPHDFSWKNIYARFVID